jgi:hypothetical protein
MLVKDILLLCLALRVAVPDLLFRGFSHLGDPLCLFPVFVLILLNVCNSFSHFHSLLLEHLSSDVIDLFNLLPHHFDSLFCLFEKVLFCLLLPISKLLVKHISAFLVFKFVCEN